MAPVNNKTITLYEEAKAGLGSLVQQTATVFIGFAVMLLVAGGAPSGFVVGLSFCLGTAFVAWSEQKRMTKMRVRSLNDSEVLTLNIQRDVTSDVVSFAVIGENTNTDPAKDGPRLFSLEPIDDKPSWTTQYYRVTLWCEHSRLPLPAINGKDDPRGVYIIALPREWLKRAAPTLRIISVPLKLALPIAIPATKLATDEAAYKAIEEQLEFGVQSANALLEGREKINDWLVDGDSTDLDPIGENTRAAILAQGSVLRELHALLKAIDPTYRFSGLVRVQNKHGEFLWVHSQYVDQY